MYEYPIIYLIELVPSYCPARMGSSKLIAYSYYLYREYFLLMLLSLLYSWNSEAKFLVCNFYWTGAIIQSCSECCPPI